MLILLSPGGSFCVNSFIPFNLYWFSSLSRQGILNHKTFHGLPKSATRTLTIHHLQTVLLLGLQTPYTLGPRIFIRRVLSQSEHTSTLMRFALFPWCWHSYTIHYCAVDSMVLMCVCFMQTNHYRIQGKLQSANKLQLWSGSLERSTSSSFLPAKGLIRELLSSYL